MDRLSLPTASSVGMLPRVLENLEKEYETINAQPAQVTTQKKVAVWATASFATFIAASFDEVVNVALFAVKIVPIALNETVGRLTGLSKYVTSDALKRSELLAHVNNVASALVVQVNALLIFVGLESPEVAAVVGRAIQVFPKAQQAVVGKEGSAEKKPSSDEPVKVT